MEVLRCKDISKEFPQGTSNTFPKSQKVLSRVSLALSATEVLCVVGPSGCGKTSLLRILAGLDSEYSGECQRNVSQEMIAYMPQRDALMPWRTVAENVGFGMELTKVSKQQRVDRVKDALAQVGLSECALQYPAELSGGMRQRVAFARTLVCDAKVFLLDEPLSQLDFVTRRLLADRLKRYVSDKAAAAVIVTHSIEEASFLGTKVLVLGGVPASVQGLFTYDDTFFSQSPDIPTQCCTSAGQMFDKVVQTFEDISV